MPSIITLSTTGWFTVVVVFTHLCTRSPLNVVHAGLDLLMAEIKEAEPEADTVPISRNTAELIRHIFSSSESAIDLLNDLLQYEQLDAGGVVGPSSLTIYSTEPSLCYVRDTQLGAELAWSRWISAQ